MNENAFHLRGIKLIAIAAIVFVTGSVAAQVADPVRLRQTVAGYRIELVVEAILDPAIANPRHSAGYEHRVTLTVREPKIGHRVQLAAATLSVAERGHPGPTYELKAIQSPEGPAYEARVRMALEGTYRMVLHATPEATSQALTAKFSYAAAAHSAQAATLVQSVHGYRVELAVEPQSGDEHRVAVRLLHAGRPIRITSASLHVAERGHEEVVPLGRVGTGDEVVYEARVRMGSKGPYRITVHATPTGRRQPIEARFEYRVPH